MVATNPHDPLQRWDVLRRSDLPAWASAGMLRRVNRQELDQILLDTLDDGRMSRSERRAVKDVLAELGHHPERMAQVRNQAFDIVRERFDGDAEILEWLEWVVKLTVRAREGDAATIAEVHTSPGAACLDRLLSLINGAARTIDVCVFTITDDRITSALLGAKKRGVTVRVISDDDKAHDLGSDVDRIEAAGIGVKVDRSPNHMHHKFALFDRRVVATGSYNWTRSAASRNQENIVVTDDPRLVQGLAAAFEDLWAKF